LNVENLAAFAGSFSIPRLVSAASFSSTLSLTSWASRLRL
jgi:hypothetical protein